MTRNEILKSYRVVGIAVPRKGQIILTAKNCCANAVDGGYGVERVTKNWKNVSCTILEKI